MKKIIAILSILSLLFGMTACKAPELTIASGPKGGIYHDYGAALAKAIEEELEFKTEIDISKGALSNLQIVDLKPDQITICQKDLLNHSWNQTGIFKQDGKIDSLRAIGSVYTEIFQIITNDENIQSIEDLKGKHVSLGLTGTGGYYIATNLLNAAGISKFDLEFEEYDFEETFRKMQKGELDAAFLFAGTPTPALREYMEKHSLKLLSIEQKYMDILIQNSPALKPYTIPAGTYQGQAGDVKTLATEAVLLCGADCPEEQIYQIIAMVYGNPDCIRHEKAGSIGIENAAEGIDLPFHKGAAKYYSEHHLEVFSK